MKIKKHECNSVPLKHIVFGGVLNYRKSCRSCRRSHSGLKQEPMWRCALEMESSADSSLGCCSRPVKSQATSPTESRQRSCLLYLSKSTF